MESLGECRVVPVEVRHTNGLKSTRKISLGVVDSKISCSISFSDINFNKFYSDQTSLINSSTLFEIKKIREHYKIEVTSLNFVIKNKILSVGMKRFLKGKRKFICMLLHYSKQKIKEINRFDNGGV